ETRKPRTPLGRVPTTSERIGRSERGVHEPIRRLRNGGLATAPTRESAPAGLLQGNGGTFKVAAPNAGCRANRVDWKSPKVLPASLAPVRRRGSFWTPLSKLRSYERNY